MSGSRASSPRAATTKGPLRWLEPWYAAYGIVGLMVLGVAPIFMPLTVDGAGGKPTDVGIVVASFYLGGLAAPVLSSLADRTGTQRPLFIALFPIMAVGVAGFALAEGTWAWAALAFVFGGCGSLAGSLAGLFVVEAHPENEWNQRISWFRLAYGAGQVLGLIIASLLVAQLQVGWLATAALLALGTVLARIRLPKLKPARAPSRSEQSAQPVTNTSKSSRYRLFLLTWLLAMTGIQTFFNVVPLVMRDAFEVSASLASVLFLIGAAIGTLLYPVVGTLAGRIGAGLVLLLGLLLTAVSFAAMFAAYALHLDGRALIGGSGLIVAATAYSFVVASATMLIVKLTSGSEGSAMGLLNGIIAAGAAIGAIIPSFLANLLGYPSLTALAAGTLVLATIVGLPLLRTARATKQ